MATKTDFSEAYKIKCRAIWYQNECPSPRKCLELDLMPADELGRTVEKGTLEHWVDSWVQWRDAMDAELSVRTEEKVLQTRIRQIEKQLNQNIEMGDKAFEEIMAKPFDSSAAANQAFFKTQENVRGLMQVQKVIADMTNMETPAIMQKLKELAERANATVVDGTVEDKEESAEPND